MGDVRSSRRLPELCFPVPAWRGPVDSRGTVGSAGCAGKLHRATPLSSGNELQGFLQNLNLVHTFGVLVFRCLRGKGALFGFFEGVKRGISKKAASLLLLFPNTEFSSDHCQLQILILLTVPQIYSRYWNNSCYWDTCFYSKNASVQLSSFKAHVLFLVMETQVPSAFWLCRLGCGKLESKDEACTPAFDTLCHCLGLFSRQEQFPNTYRAPKGAAAMKLTFNLYNLRILCFRRMERYASPKHQPEFAVIST